jgi:hypothetical protein
MVRVQEAAGRIFNATFGDIKILSSSVSAIAFFIFIHLYSRFIRLKTVV